MRSVHRFLFVFLAATAVHADTGFPRDQVSFQVSVSEEVDNDLLVVRLFVQHEARRQADTADRVNKDMAWALAEARKVAAVKAQTLDYRTSPLYEKREIRGWQTRQSLQLESADAAALTELMGTLQERLGVESLGYEVSPQVREVVEQRLTDAAIGKFSARAARIAAAFGRAGYGLMSVHIDTQGARPPIAYRGRALAMQAEVADPSVEAGQQTVTVTVNGSIELEGD